jgi:prepilin-type N-terminal cleavage/methylation domain-containing protein
LAIKNKGFTLLEILVVIAIISIMSAIVVLNISLPTYAKFKSDVNKIAITFNLIVEHAIFTNSVIVCKVYKNKLKCKAYKNDEWNDLNINDIITWTWPRDIIIKKVYINDSQMKDDQNIYFMPNGLQVPISFLLSNGNYEMWIDGDVNGKFSLNN